MKVKIRNCPDVYFKPYVEKAVQFYAKELMFMILSAQQ